MIDKECFEETKTKKYFHAIKAINLILLKRFTMGWFRDSDKLH